MNFLKYVKLSDQACELFKATPFSAGYDLCSAYDYIIFPFDKILIKTDIAIELKARKVKFF